MKVLDIANAEAVALEEADGTFSKRIRGHWLTVKALGNRQGAQKFRYTWGVNTVPRAVAERVLAGAAA